LVLQSVRIKMKALNLKETRINRNIHEGELGTSSDQNNQHFGLTCNFDAEKCKHHDNDLDTKSRGG
jgi:hypothetical protein